MKFCCNNKKKKNRQQKQNLSSSSSSSSHHSSNSSNTSRFSYSPPFCYNILLYGIDSFYPRRKRLLLLAFVVNVVAITSIGVACIAIQTSSKLQKVGWATATTSTTTIVSSNTTTTLISSNHQCFNNSSKSNITIEVNVWLGLKGYYGQCTARIIIDSDNNNNTTTTFSIPNNTTTQHSDKFCSPGDAISSNTTTTTGNADSSLPIPNNINNIGNNNSKPLDDIMELFGINNGNSPPGIHSNDFQCIGSGNTNQQQQQDHTDDSSSVFVSCELITDAQSILFLENDNSNTTTTLINPYENPNCTACKDTSRNCVSTLLSAACFGVFPLILTIRRYCSSKRDSRLRLRTMFFGLLAIILGLHAFHKFHYECVKIGMPTSFSVEICLSECNNNNNDQGRQPFLIQVPMDFQLHTGAQLVIMGAILKFTYLILHYVTPVVNNNQYESIPDNHGDTVQCHTYDDDDDYDDQSLLEQQPPSSTTFQDEYLEDLKEEDIAEQREQQQPTHTKFLVGYVV